MIYFEYLTLFAILLAKSRWDILIRISYERNNKKKPNSKAWFVVLVALLCIAVLLLPNNSWETITAFFFGGMFFFMGLFDPVYNILYGEENILYVGDTSGIWSRFMNFWRDPVAVLWRLGFVSISVACFYKVYV